MKRIKISAFVDEEIHKALAKLSKKEQRPQRVYVQEALRRYLKRRKML